MISHRKNISWNHLPCSCFKLKFFYFTCLSTSILLFSTIFSALSFVVLLKFCQISVAFLISSSHTYWTISVFGLGLLSYFFLSSPNLSSKSFRMTWRYSYCTSSLNFFVKSNQEFFFLTDEIKLTCIFCSAFEISQKTE